MGATYEELLEHNPKVERFLPQKVFDAVHQSGEKTEGVLGDQWRKNFRKNVRNLIGKHGLAVDDMWGFGANKAVIAIGAGASLKNNWELLKKLCHYNSKFPFEQQPFFFIASNHQFKPCLADGIIPHAVMLVDASNSDPIYDQLCRDISHRANNVILICSLNAHPRITMGWDKQKRLICFYMPRGEENWKFYEKETGKDPREKAVLQGGNVMNAAWATSLTALQSNIFMAVGNDLSYKMSKSIEERRKAYYFDGDYSSNLASRRDEAKKEYKWLGFKIKQNIFTGEDQVDFEPRLAAHSLFMYKSWLEANIAIQDVSPASWHYYNCSEEGILGVVCKGEGKDNLDKPENWQLLDEIFPNRYHTQSLKTATTDFLALWQVWRNQRKGTPIIVSPQDANILQGPTGGASNIVLS